MSVTSSGANGTTELVQLRRKNREALRTPADPLLAALQGAMSSSRVLSRAIDRVAYASDASVYRLVPRAVVQPNAEREVAAILRIATEHRVPVTFRAGGTSLSGQSVTDGILVDLSKHWSDLAIKDAGRLLRFQPGVIGARANAALAPLGRRIGPDPASIDACMMGGILANNASGMCCGVTDNAYHTLDSIRFVLPSGVTVDTSRADADALLLREAPHVHRGILALRDRVRGDETLIGRIRSKYRIKNTTGYAINALLDHDSAADILAHLLIGSEGTLGFIAEATLRTIADLPEKRTGLLFFATPEEAFAAAPALARSGALAVEFMDAACLYTAGDFALGVRLRELGPSPAALLVEYGYASTDERDSNVAEIDRVIAGLATLLPARLTSDAYGRAALWKTRKNLFPAVGATKKSGEAVIIEDVAFPPERQAVAFRDLRALLADHGYGDAILFGHAKDGNTHFVLKQSFSSNAEIARYERFMDAVVDVVLSHDGSLKAEHGTGRNIAPFVEAEWGEDAYAIMRELKELVDPERILNPGVLIDADPRAHVTNLKALPPVDAEVDRCIECGFCEPVCPSRRLTLTPRQRIVVRREMARLADGDARAGAERAELVADYVYDGVESCAADGMCATACPVKIDTGVLMKRLRHESHSPRASRAAQFIANHAESLEHGMRLMLRLAHTAESVLGAESLASLTRLGSKLLGTRLPVWTNAIPRVANVGAPGRNPERADCVYMPSCLSRIMGQPRDHQRSLPETFLVLCERAGIHARVPSDLGGSCCGLPFGSKGFTEAHGSMLTHLVDAMWRWSDEGKLTVVIDATSCLYAITTAANLLDLSRREKLEAMRIVDSIVFARDVLAPRLPLRKLPKRVALHPPCSARKLGIAGASHDVASLCADEALVPIDLGCCGMAGDRGMLLPELTDAATFDERAEVRSMGCDGHYASNLTCEIGMTEAVGAPYVSLLYLLAEASEPRTTPRLQGNDVVST